MIVKTAPVEGEQKADEEDDGPAPLGNGGEAEKYTWTQTLSNLEMYIDVKPGTKSKDIKVDLKANSLKVVAAGEAPIKA